MLSDPREDLVADIDSKTSLSSSPPKKKLSELSRSFSHRELASISDAFLRFTVFVLKFYWYFVKRNEMTDCLGDHRIWQPPMIL
ncbi:hypothetical protein CEXT_291971 [Caerostris extrusa]|uniref:Uncharacterized protein n=1 Tax=Caerostris extrusa TaxID=172846 RepID=A0AAV4X128_CAEEX|nr:hypothetical protein CEXT_291971 [Caerostris extrusa]